MIYNKHSLRSNPKSLKMSRDSHSNLFNMLITKGVFRKEKYNLSNGVLTKSVFSFFGLFHEKKEDKVWNVSDIKYIEIIPLTIGWLNVISKNYALEFVLSNESIYITNLKKQLVDDFVAEAISMGAQSIEHEYKYIPSTRAMKRLYKGNVVICDFFGKMIQKTYTNKDFKEDVLHNIDNILYFDHIENNGIDGIAFGYIAGGGSAHTLEIFGLKKEEIKHIQNMLLKHNPHLEDNGVRLFKSFFPLFNPKRWFRRREMLIVTDWGILHKQYNVVINDKKYKTRTSVMPYETIKSYTSEGLFAKQIQILGATTISTEELFSQSAKSSIWNEFKIRNIKNDAGITFKPSLMYRIGLRGSSEDKKFKKTRVTLSTEHVTWTLKKEVKILQYHQIYDFQFEKKHWYSLVGDVKIRGRRTDARSGEGGDIKMDIYNIRARKGKALVELIRRNKSL